MTPMPALAEVCSTLLCSISSIIHDGALGKDLADLHPPSCCSSSCCLCCLQPAAVTLRAPSAVSVTQWGASVSVKRTWSVSAVTAALQEPMASEPMAVLVSFSGGGAHSHTPLAGFHTPQGHMIHCLFLLSLVLFTSDQKDMSQSRKVTRNLMVFSEESTQTWNILASR